MAPEGRAIYVIGCDLGTQSTKALLLDDAGTVVARAGRPYGTRYPAPGWAEQDPRDWLAALTGAVREVMTAVQAGPADVAGIGIAAQVDGIVAVDASNEPLGPAPIWMDRRATAETAAATARVGEETIRAVTGANADPSHGAPKIAWLRDHVGERPAAYLPPASYLVAQLTGARVLDPANASCLLVLDVATARWSEPLLAAFGIDPGELPSIAPSSSVAGGLRRELAEALGLRPGCPVVTGTGDEHAASLAAGLLRPGVVCDIVGTAEPVAAAALEPTRDPDGLVETHFHAAPDRWLIEHPGFVSAGTIRWLAEDVLGCEQSEIRVLSADAPPGADGVAFVPALGGASTPRWNPTVLGAFTGMTIGHDRRHLARAVVEGCAFAVRDVVDRLEALGLAGDTIR
ncbi:MAG TPA: FGGY family carbohydrate kinase, partial [Candidatus Limnocylindrales bacterium]|nr:FGGY family carbohydrate kinase [Candidatus Limnocylindrales bacterium]